MGKRPWASTGKEGGNPSSSAGSGPSVLSGDPLISRGLFRLKEQGYAVLGMLRPFRKKVILYSNNKIFSRKAKAFAGLLRRQGFKVELHLEKQYGYTDKSRARVGSSQDLWILFSGGVLPPRSLPRDYIFYIADPIDRHREHNWVNDDYFKIMAGARRIWSYSRTDREIIAGTGLPSFFVPFGYDRSYEVEFRRNTRGKKFSQDIDVLFFGNLSERRLRILGALKERAMKVVVLGRENAAYGAELDELLARSRIVLSIFYHDTDEPQTHIPDFARLDHLLANRIFVLHEKPFVDAGGGFEENVSCCPYEDMVDACASFLAQPEKRAAASQKAYEWFKATYNLGDFIPYSDLKQLVDGTIEQ